jgi:phospho-N-acetylmuramoyl-pentapeptide-transferase
VIAGVAAYIFIRIGNPEISSALALPFIKDHVVELGLGFILFAAVVIVGAGNAVNITDGLDGLAIVPVMIAAASFGLIVYLVGNAVFADYLQIHFVRGTRRTGHPLRRHPRGRARVPVVQRAARHDLHGRYRLAVAGRRAGRHCGGAKHEIVLAIVGGLFVLETVSVMVQVVSYKLTGKRVFAMAPLHHHFEQKGWKEPTIVIRFWIVAVVLALIGLSTLKLR